MISMKRRSPVIAFVLLTLAASSCVTYSNGARSYEEHVQMALDEQKQTLLDCGKMLRPARLKKGDEIRVQLEIDFKIAQDGKVTEAPVYRSTPIRSAPLESCLTNQISKLRFDPPQGRIEGVLMHYQILFSYSVE